MDGVLRTGPPWWIRALIRSVTGELASPPRLMSTARRQPSAATKRPCQECVYWHLDLGLPVSRTVRNKRLLFQPHERGALRQQPSLTRTRACETAAEQNQLMKPGRAVQ